MSDLINRKTVISVAESCTFTSSYDRTRYMDFLNYCLNTAPTIDAVPVVRGEWIKRKQWEYNVCSNCNCEAEYQYNYCPACGCDMRGEKND